MQDAENWDLFGADDDEVARYQQEKASKDSIFSLKKSKSIPKQQDIPLCQRKMSDWDEHEMDAYDTSPDFRPTNPKNMACSKIEEEVGEDEDGEVNDSKISHSNRNYNGMYFLQSTSGEEDTSSFSQQTKQNISQQQNKIDKLHQKVKKEAPQKSFFEIRDLDTGEIFDSRSEDIENKLNLQTLSMVSHYSTSQEATLNIQSTSIESNSDSWKRYWTQVKKNNLTLIDYCECGNLEEIKKLLNNPHTPTQINYQSLDNWTALHFASSIGHSNVVQYLLQQGADPFAESLMQRTALHSAAIGGNLQCVIELEKAGGKELLDKQDNHFYTALHLATENNSSSIVEYLLKQGADFSLKNHKLLTPFQLCNSKEVEQIYSNFQNANATNHSNYERLLIGGRLQRNNRADHVSKLLTLTQQVSKQEQEKKIQSIEEKTKLLREMTWKDFKFIKKLGEGSFGEVYLVERDSKHSAMKIQSKAQVLQKNLQRYVQTEKNALSMFTHPFIIKLQYAFQNQHYLFMVMEYAEGGDMGQYLNKKFKLPEDEARIYTAQVTLALEELHKKDIIFRDLKPDNVVLDKDGNAKLTDFGLSKEGIKVDSLTKSFCGSVAYLPPEILSKKPHSRTVDWYLLGTFLFELLVGVPPYYDNKKEVLFDNIKKGPLKIPKSMSTDAKDLIKKLLNRNPRERLGAKQDSEEIKIHPFFKSINWDNVLNGKQKPPAIEIPKVSNIQKLKVDFDQKPISAKSKAENTANLQNNHIEKWSFIQ